MTLFVTGAAIFALLLASYSQRGAWAAWCSKGMSIAALVGLLLIPTVEDPSKLRASLTWLFRQLPLVLDQQTLDDLTAAIARGSSAAICDAKKGPGCVTAASHPVAPIAHDSETPQSSPLPEAGEANQPGATVNGLAAKRDAEDTSGSPVMWLLDEPIAVSDGSPRVLISGINVSNVTLNRVRATLKPDATQREVALDLKILGDKLDEEAIPAGAPFTLGLEMSTIESKKQIGGAIIAFRYTYLGKQRADIWYLTPPMIARFVKRG
jgi:hypothetical protein